MKQIIVMRHAKSDWGDASLDDFDRPLNQRGKHDAPAMGQKIKEKQLVPDLIISSPAQRARQTAFAVAKACGYAREIVFNDGFYDGYLEPVFEALRSTADNVQRVMVFGHNPTWENLVAKLSGQFRAMPTAAVAVLHFNKDSWADCAPNTCTLKELLTPKEH